MRGRPSLTVHLSHALCSAVLLLPHLIDARSPTVGGLRTGAGAAMHCGAPIGAIAVVDGAGEKVRMFNMSEHVDGARLVKGACLRHDTAYARAGWRGGGGSACAGFTLTVHALNCRYHPHRVLAAGDPAHTHSRHRRTNANNNTADSSLTLRTRAVGMPQLDLIATTSTEGPAVRAPLEHSLTSVTDGAAACMQGPYWVSTWRLTDAVLELRVPAQLGLNVLCYVHHHACLLGAGSAEGAGACARVRCRARWVGRYPFCTGTRCRSGGHLYADHRL